MLGAIEFMVWIPMAVWLFAEVDSPVVVRSSRLVVVVKEKYCSLRIYSYSLGSVCRCPIAPPQ